MKTLSQKEAVYKVVMSATKGKGLSEVAKQKIYAQLIDGFVNGRIEFKLTEGNLVKLADERALRNYIIGLTSNWLRKDPRLAKLAS